MCITLYRPMTCSLLTTLVSWTLVSIPMLSPTMFIGCWTYDVHSAHSHFCLTTCDRYSLVWNRPPHRKPTSTDWISFPAYLCVAEALKWALAVLDTRHSPDKASLLYGNTSKISPRMREEFLHSRVL
ncbi:hypothetical protein V1507DRAFT_460091 [Lipomyces tetrasporus]